MNKRQKDEQYKLFADAFHEVVVPLLENTATKDDLRGLKEDMKDVKERVYRIETKLDKIDDRLDRQGKTLDGHGKRIKKLESHARITS